MKKIFALLLAAMMLLALVACGDSENSNSSQPVEKSSETSSETEETVPETYTVGDTATTKSYKLTVEGLNVVESDNQFVQPDDGNQFIEVLLMLENTSESEMHISMLNFDAYVDGFSISQDVTVASVSTRDNMGGTVGSGKKLSGSLCYEVPENWEELEVTVDIGTDEIVLLMQNQQGEA